jgi:hypothetical protein
MKIKEMKQISDFCPSQWEIKLEDGKMIYVRYRYGWLSVCVSKDKTDDIFDAVDGEVIYGEQLGGEYDGSLEERELLKIFDKIGIVK